MYEVLVQAEFRASHQLRLLDGQLEPWHDHLWMAEARFRGPELDDIGVLVDFTTVQEILRALTTALSDQHLNDSPLLVGVNPSAEQLARMLFLELRRRLPADSPLVSVLVREAPGCFAAYQPDL